MSAESKTRMTEGSISRKIILFAIPLFLGNLFQQLYNTADSLIVGNFLGSNALAAVSSSGNLIFLMVGTMERKTETICRRQFTRPWPLESRPVLR